MTLQLCKKLINERTLVNLYISDSEIDEILSRQFGSTTKLREEDVPHLSQSINDSEDPFISSQEIFNPPTYYESPIEEYFSSKSKHDDSSVFWDETMKQFAPDSLID